MRFPPERLTRSTTAALALALVASACVSPDDPGVTVDARSAQLVFGVKLPEQSAPTPAQVAADTAVRGFQPPPLDFPDFSGFDIPLFEQPPPVEDPCPPAGGDAAPKELTEATVSGPPRVGVFEWRGLSRDYDVDTRQWKAWEEAPIERRAVRRYQEINGGHTFQMVQPLPDGHFLVSTYEVREGESVDQPAGEGVIQLQRAREPEDGLVLAATEVRDANGELVPGIEPFRPSTGVLLLPLPVVSGENYVSVAVDPRTGMTVFHQATVRSRARIDACGEVADGWLVNATQSVSIDNQTTRIEYSYVVATQFGATLLKEDVTPFVPGEGTGEGYPAGQSIRQIAQLEGDPLPPELE